MRSPRSARGLAAAAALSAVAGSVAGCATVQERNQARDQNSCTFMVYNRTPDALEIRLYVRDFSTAPIGSVNPGELLTHSVPCSEQWVRVRGVGIPVPVGAPPRVRSVEGWADLVEGERVGIALYWP